MEHQLETWNNYYGICVRNVKHVLVTLNIYYINESGVRKMKQCYGHGSLIIYMENVLEICSML